MKLAFLISCDPVKETVIKKILETMDYSPVQSMNPEEIDQTGKQIGQVILCFTDSNFAYKFLKNNKWQFKTLNLLFMAAQPPLSQDASRKLKEIQLNIVTPKELTRIKKMIQGLENEEGEEEELEFLVQDPQGKKHAA